MIGFIRVQIDNYTVIKAKRVMMGQPVEHYSDQLHREIEQTPDELLPELLDAVHVFKKELLERAALTEAEKAKIAEGIRQAEAGQFASDEKVKDTFKRWGVDAKD